MNCGCPCSPETPQMQGIPEIAWLSRNRVEFVQCACSACGIPDEVGGRRCHIQFPLGILALYGPFCFVCRHLRHTAETPSGSSHTGVKRTRENERQPRWNEKRPHLSSHAVPHPLASGPVLFDLCCRVNIVILEEFPRKCLYLVLESACPPGQLPGLVYASPHVWSTSWIYRLAHQHGASFPIKPPRSTLLCEVHPDLASNGWHDVLGLTPGWVFTGTPTDGPYFASFKMVSWVKLQAELRPGVTSAEWAESFIGLAANGGVKNMEVVTSFFLRPAIQELIRQNEIVARGVLPFDERISALPSPGALRWVPSESNSADSTSRL